MAGDLKLTVDISALLQAQSIVKKMDGQVINLKFNTTGLESVNMMAKGLTTSSAKTKMLVSDIGQLGSAIKKVTAKDEFGNKTKEVKTYQQAIGQTRQEIEKFNKEGNSTVTTIDKISDATSKYAANAKKQDDALNKINKLSAQKYSGVIDQAGLSKQKSIVSALDPKSLDFDQQFSSATKAITRYEVAASNALFTQQKMSKLYKGTGDQAVSMFKEQQKAVDALTKGSGDQAVALFKEKQATIAALQKGTGDQAVDYFKAQEKAAKIELTNLGKKEAKIAEITTAEKKYGKVIDKNALAGIKSSFEGLDPKDINYEKKHTQLAQSLSKVTSSAKDAAYEQNQLTQANKKNLLSVDNIKESMGTAAVRTVEWAATMGVLYGAVNAVRSMVTTSTAINDQMNSIKMVTGASDGEIKSMLTNYQNIATQLSSTTSAVAASAEVWVRQGRSIADTNDLIKTSTVLSKVGFMDSATSAKLLTSSINGYGIAAKDAMSVVDKMSAIDVNAATSTEDLAVAMAQTASGAKIAGVSMDELLSYIATISDVTQASGDTIGVSLKTMFARINSVKLGSLTDEEGQDISRVETALKQYGITLRTTNGTAKNTGDILDELSVKWGTLTGLQKSEIAMQMAGVHQKEKFLVLMENYNKALGYQEIAANSAGSAMQKMSIWEESTEAATQRLTNQWEILSTNMVDSNFTKGVINLGTLSLSALNSDIGQLVVKASMLAAVFAAIGAVQSKSSKAWAAADVISGTGTIASLKAIMTAQKEYNQAQKGIDVKQTAFTKGTLAADVATQGLGKTITGLAMTPLGMFAIGLTAVAATLKIAELATVSYEEHVEKLTGLNTKYSENVSQITSAQDDIAKNKSRINDLYSLGASITNENKEEVASLEATNQQLAQKITSLEAINDITKQQMQDEAIATMNSKSETIDVETGYVDNFASGVTQEYVTGMDKVKSQIQEVKDLNKQIQLVQIQKKNGVYEGTDEEYLTHLDNLKTKQGELSKAANETSISINDQAKNLILSTDEGRKYNDMVKDMNRELTMSNNLVAGSSSATTAGVKDAGVYEGAEAQNYSDFTGAIQTIDSGLQTGMTDTGDFHEAMLLLFGDTPPTNMADGLEKISTLFNANSESATDLSNYLSSGNFLQGGVLNSQKLQQEMGISGEAVATLKVRLAESGSLLATTFTDASIAITTMGNGLGLAATQSVELENKIGELYGRFKSDNNLTSATDDFNNYIAGLNLTKEDSDVLLENWQYLTEGLTEQTVTAFSGLKGDTRAVVEDLVVSSVDAYKENLTERFSSSGQISLHGMFDTSELETSLTSQLKAAGTYTDQEIENYVTKFSNETIQLKLRAAAELAIDLPSEQESKVLDAIQQGLNTETGEISLAPLNAVLTELNITGDPAQKIQDEVTKLSERSKAEVKVTANTDNAVETTTAFTKPEEKKITVAADTFAATSQLMGVKGNIDSLHDKEITITTNLVTNETHTVTVVNSNGTGAGIGAAQSATGRINIDTSAIGTQSLIGEEGEETLIRNGNVSFIGTSGAEIIPIRDGDTILPADITKRIKSGQIPMYADGKYSVSVSTSAKDMSWYAKNREDSSMWDGLQAEPPEDEAAKKAFEDQKKNFDKELDYHKHLLDLGEISEGEYYKRLNEINVQYFKGKTEFLDVYRDHEKEVHDYLQKLEEERLKSLEENYDSSSSYVLDLLDKEIDALKEKEELSEKQEKVDNLKANKNQRVYHEGSGWTWEADQTAIAEAEKDVKDDSASAKLQEYRDKWASISDNYENEQNKLDATYLLGDDFEKKLLDGDLGMLRDFATKYSKVLGDISNNEGDTSVPLLDYAKAWETDEIKRLMGTESTGGILTAALNNNLSGLTTSAISSAQSSSNDNSINLYGDIKLDNVTDFDSFITEAKHYARVNSPKR